jgi:glutamate carboxypeptidase
MDTKYASYLEKIRSQQQEMVACLIEWCDQNSYSNHIEGLEHMLQMLEKAFGCLNGTVKHIPIPRKRTIDENGRIASILQGKALQIKKRPRAPIQLLLAGHMDTVFPLSSPFQKAIRKGNRISGPGAADMKGGLLVMLKALEALESSPWCKQVGWEVLITPDEETGSCGSEHLYIKAAQKHHAGLLFEPSFSDGLLVSSRKGSKNITAFASGKPAHAGRDFFSGRNALTGLAHWLLNVERLTDKDKGIIVNVGHIEGGGAFNIVPDKAAAKINIRTETLQDAATVDECLRLLAEESCHQTGITLQLHTLAERGPKPLDEGTRQLFSLFQQCGTSLNQSLQWRPSGGVCDGNILASQGLPTLDTLGVVGGGLHTPDEYAEVESLTERACLTALFLLKLASGEFKLPQREITT